jgi:hypothetical protein
MNLPAGSRIPLPAGSHSVSSVQQSAIDHAHVCSHDCHKETSDTRSKSSDPSNTGGTEGQKSLMRRKLNKVFQKQSLVASEDQHRASIDSFVCKALFRGMQFTNPAYLDKSGPVARSMYKQCHVTLSNKTFDLEWDDWIMKHFRNTINAKRICMQAIHGERADW